MAINFVKNDDIKILRDIEQYYSTQVRDGVVAVAVVSGGLGAFSLGPAPGRPALAVLRLARAAQPGWSCSPAYLEVSCMLCPASALALQLTPHSTPTPAPSSPG